MNDYDNPFPFGDFCDSMVRAGWLYEDVLDIFIFVRSLDTWLYKPSTGHLCKIDHLHDQHIKVWELADWREWYERGETPPPI